jgi:hypothetical protein
MNTGDLALVLPDLFTEIVFGSADRANNTYMLNRGDAGLLGSLENLSANAASSSHAGGASIAAHAEHLRYGLALVNRWAAGGVNPWRDADWTRAWKHTSISETEWRTLRDDLRREAEAWRMVLSEPREVSDAAAHWVTGSVVHIAYHLGAIRQIDRAARGPTAEDERRYEQTAAKTAGPSPG